MTRSASKLSSQLRKASAIAAVFVARGHTDPRVIEQIPADGRKVAADLAGVTFPSDETWQLVVAHVEAFATSPIGAHA